MEKVVGIARRAEMPYVDQWINNDLRPLEAKRRTWTFLTIHNYWLSGNCCVAIFLTGSALIPLGLSWWQAIIVVIVGNSLMTVFLFLGSLHGIYYHIGFSVSNRAVWGMWGAQFPVWNRIFLSFVWYGFNAFVGGECFEVLLLSWDPKLEEHIHNTIPASTGLTSAKFVSYFIFCILCLPLLMLRPHRLGKLYAIASAVTLTFFLVLLIWALATMGSAGFGDTLNSGSTFKPSPGGPPTLGWLFVYGIISSIGHAAAGILNQNDFARLATSPTQALWGYSVSSPLWSVFTAVLGILTVAATQKRFDEAIWNPADILARLLQDDPSSGTRAALFFSGLALSFSQGVNNVTGNALVGGLDISSVWPKYINLRRGAFIVAILSPIVNPWRLVNTANTFITVVSGYGLFLAPMTGLMVSHWFIIAKGKYSLDDMYRGNSSSIYWYTRGFNYRALVAWLVGFVPGLPGLIATANPSVHISQGATNLFYINYLYAFFLSASVFVLLHRVFPDEASDAFANNPMTAREVRQLCEDRWEGDLEETTRGLRERESAAETASEKSKSDGSDRLAGQHGHANAPSTTVWAKETI